MGESGDCLASCIQMTWFCVVSVESKKLQRARGTDMKKVTKLAEKAQENVVKVEMERLEREGVNLMVLEVVIILGKSKFNNLI